MVSRGSFPDAAKNTEKSARSPVEDKRVFHPSVFLAGQAIPHHPLRPGQTIFSSLFEDEQCGDAEVTISLNFRVFALDRSKIPKDSGSEGKREHFGPFPESKR